MYSYFILMLKKVYANFVYKTNSWQVAVIHN